MSARQRIKRWWKSKTHWFNISMAVTWSGIALTYINDLGLEPEVAGWVGFGLAIFQSFGNMFLRNISVDKIGKSMAEFTGS